MDILALYQLADDQNIDVDWFLLNKAESLSAELPDGSCVIALDPTKIRSQAEHKVKLGHELGHCFKGAFYNPSSPWDIRQRHENRADRWEIQQLLPFEDMRSAMHDGCVTPWDLAECFGVTEQLIKKAYDYYTGPCGLYF